MKIDIRKIVKRSAVSLAVCAGVIAITAATVGDGFALGKNMEILVNMFRDINLFYVDKVNPDDLLSDAAAGMVRRLDPYTEYFSEEDMEGFEVLTTGKYAGIGSVIRKKGDYVAFAQPYKDSPADKEGIEIGDKIIEIEGKDAKGMSTSDVSNILKGEPGTTVKLKVEKFFTGEVVQLKIKREIITVSGVPYYGMLNDSVGIIQHSDFTEDCSNDMRKAVMELKASGAKALILDYRNNGGGILQEAVKILSMFLPKGTEVVSTKAKNASNNATFVTQNEPIDTSIPIAVLTNSGTASAAEIVSGALQDMDRAVLLGQRTYGKGLVQTPRPLGYNAYVKITTAKYYLPSGRCIQAIDYTHRNEDGSVGLVPDSLIQEFRTHNGRKVYDGGGVMPDLPLVPEYVSRFAYIVYNKDYINDFADEYCKRHHDTLKVVPGEFSLDDNGYEEFVEFMADKDVDWQSETAATINALKQAATRERYYDSIKRQIDDMEAALQDDKDDNLKLYKKELIDLIEGEIVLRYGYSRGVAAHSLTKDTEVRAALELLGDGERYRKIIDITDTKR